MLFHSNSSIAYQLSAQHVQRIIFWLKLFGCFYASQQFKTHVLLLVLSSLVLFNQTLSAGEGTLKLTTGAEYITGNFGGTQSIDELYIPFTASYSDNGYVYRLTIPYISVTAPMGTILADGSVISDTGIRRTESGIGDVIVGLTYRDILNAEPRSNIELDVTAKVKFGTADLSKGLGTGENDYTVQAELYNYHDRLTSFGILGYKYRGDPSGINLSNSLLALVGGFYRISSSLKVGLDFSFQESLFSALDEQEELTAYFGYRLSNSQYLRGYIIQGFGDTSPDWGLGVMITIRQ